MALNRRELLALVPSACATALSAAETAPVIDTHTHFYDPTRPEGVPWPGKNDKTLYRKVLPSEFKTLVKPHGLTGTVVVEASPWLADNDWLLKLAESEPFLRGIVGRLTPGEEKFAEHVAKYAKNKLYRGIRINGNELERNLSIVDFRKDLGRLMDAQLTLDVNGSPSMLPNIVKLASAFPKLHIVVNHLANVPINGKEPPELWQRDIEKLAAHENVWCKISALVEGSGKSDGTAPKELAYYAPTLNVVWKHLGAKRLLYASNWPVSDKFASYATVFGLIEAFLKEKTVPEREAIFGRNALVAYRLS